MATVRRHGHTRSAVSHCSHSSIADMREQVKAFDAQLRALEAERISLLGRASRCSTEKPNISLSLPESGLHSPENSEGYEGSAQKEQLETFGMSSPKVHLPLHSPPSSLSSESPPPFPSTSRPHSPPRVSLSPSQREIQSLRVSLAHSLQYQDSLYKEVEHLMDLFTREKHRWREQTKILKSEHQNEVEALRRAYEERLRIYKSEERKPLPFHLTSDYAKLVDDFNKEKEKLRVAMESQQKIAVEAAKEEMKLQFDLELQRETEKRCEEEAKAVLEEVARKTQEAESKLRMEIRCELEKEFEIEEKRTEQSYEQLLKTRISCLKTESDRRIKELQEQVSTLKREKLLLALGGGKRAALEELEVDSFVNTSQILCSKCSTLLHVSKELEDKLAKFRNFSSEWRKRSLIRVMWVSCTNRNLLVG